MVAYALKKECQEYANVIKTCSDCYESRLNCEIQPNFFESVCTKPHLIVLAKVDGFPLWPAKLISYNDDRRIATVQCFGDHQEADVPFDKCFLYSNEIRRKKDKKHITNLEKGYKVRKIDLFCAVTNLLQTLLSVFQEVERHIQNIVHKFGSFVPASSKIAISDVKQHLIDMFPSVYAEEETATSDDYQPAASLNESHGAHNGNHSGNGGTSNNNKRKLLEELGEISVKIAAHEKEIQNLKDQQGRIQARILEN